MEQRDNYTWISVRNKINGLQNDEIVTFSSWMDEDKTRYLNVLIKLGYIERTFVYNKYVQRGTFKRLNFIPDELRWMDAQEEVKSLNVSLKKKMKKHTLWNHIIEKINDHDDETFNANEMFPFEKYASGPDLYICKIYKLGYLERLDRHRNYKIVEKIPENLSSAMANKLLYDKIYNRQRKIQLLKEKMAS